MRLTPRGGADRLDGWDRDDAGRTFLRARVKAAPVDGEANAALEALVARTLGLPRRAVSIGSGALARFKMLRIEGLDEAEVRVRLGASQA